MKNIEKYRTAKERYTAFCRFDCGCADCKFGSECSRCISECALRWLDLEAEEEPILPCPYCGGNVVKSEPNSDGRIRLYCQTLGCGYRAAFGLPDEAIAKHNFLSRAAMEAKGEVSNG